MVEKSDFKTSLTWLDIKRFVTDELERIATSGSSELQTNISLRRSGDGNCR